MRKLKDELTKVVANFCFKQKLAHLMIEHRFLNERNIL